MARWQVTLTKPIPRLNDDYPGDFFPRPFHYKLEAVKMVHEVQRKGGDARVEPYNKKNRDADTAAQWKMRYPYKENT